MHAHHHLLASALALAGLSLAPGAARAAQSYDNCTGFIDSLPATISTQGTWCLRKDLGTAITSGNAITVATNNVIIDCNDFKLGGMTAGSASMTTGIHAEDRQNVTVRNCAVRGFHFGLYFNKGAGHLVEDNRFDNNLAIGIFVGISDGSVVRNNRVFDTGGADRASITALFSAGALAEGNVVSGVFGSRADTSVRGIYFSGAARGNVVNGLIKSGAGTEMGIEGGHGTIAERNTVRGGLGSTGIKSGYCNGNTVFGPTTPIDCMLGSGNLPNNGN